MIYMWSSSMLSSLFCVMRARKQYIKVSFIQRRTEIVSANAPSNLTIDSERQVLSKKVGENRGYQHIRVEIK